MLATLVVAYLAMSRSFAYLGWPPANVFIGELALSGLFVLARRPIVGQWRRWADSTDPLLRVVAWSLLWFVAYGVVSLTLGLMRGHPMLVALKGLGFHYYALFLLVGAWAGRESPGLLRRLLLGLAWVNGLYGIAFVLWLGRVSAVMPGTESVPLFGMPLGSAVALLGLVTFDLGGRAQFPLMLLNAFVLLGMQLRAEWLALAVGLGVVIFLTRRIERPIDCAAAVGLLLAVGALLDFRWPSPTGRGGELSARELFARAVAVVSPDVARDLSTHASFYVDTAQWRVAWWHRIIETMVQGSTAQFFFGWGLGFPLHSLVDYVPADIRSPHNIALYVLSYEGLVGLALFAAVLCGVARMLWRAFDAPRTFGLAFGAAVVTIAAFSNYLEAPFGAIPFYTILGLSIGTGLGADRDRRAPSTVRARHHGIGCAAW